METMTRIVVNEIDRAPSGLDTFKVTQEVSESVVWKTNDRLSVLGEICLAKMVEKYFSRGLEQYLNEHLPAKVHKLVSEIFTLPHRIGKSLMVIHPCKKL